MIDDRQGTPMTADARSHRHRTLLAYAAAAALATLGACTGSDPGPAVTTPASGSSSTRSAAPATTTTSSAPSPTTSGPDFPVGLPQAAKAHTAKGAEAFVGHFLNTLNRAWTKPDAELLDDLCQFESSKSCMAYRKTAADLDAKGQHYDGDPVSVSRVVALTEQKGKRRVLFQGSQERRSVVTDAGTTVLTDPRRDLQIMFFLDWGRTGWTVYDAKLAKF